ncbi:MAG: hypothetical protein ACJAS6_000399 [Rickettsiales bacterium]|jgi:hypothetical protein
MSISDMVHQAIRLKWSYIFLLLFLMLVVGKNSLAQDQDKYVVSDIVISSEGKSPNQSRTKAIADGQRSAFIVLLSRLGFDADVSDNFQNEEIADMVASQQIFDEKIAGNKYSATLNLNFSRRFVQHHLDRKDEIEKSIDENSYLIIPIKASDEKMLIWEEENDWMLSWKRFMENNEYPQIKLTKGDFEDVGNFNIENIKNNDFSNFGTSFYKYGSGSIVLVYFDFDSIENKVNIDLHIIDKLQNNQVRLEFINVNQLPMQELAQKVVKKTADYIIKDDGKVGFSKFSPENTDIDILVSDLKEWIIIKNKIERSHLVSNLQIKSISRDLIKINADYGVDKDDIIASFEKEDLFLTSKLEGGYFLSLKNFN